MSLDTSFMNLIRGSRITNYMGLVMTPGVEFRYAPDYTFLEIPLVGFEKSDGEMDKEKALRNQYVRVVPACHLNVKGNYKIQIEPNPALAEYGMIQPGYYMHPGDAGVPSFYFHARKDTQITDVDYAVRLYMRG